MSTFKQVAQLNTVIFIWNFHMKFIQSLSKISQNSITYCIACYGRNGKNPIVERLQTKKKLKAISLVWLQDKKKFQVCVFVLSRPLLRCSNKSVFWMRSFNKTAHIRLCRIVKAQSTDQCHKLIWRPRCPRCPRWRPLCTGSSPRWRPLCTGSSPWWRPLCTGSSPRWRPLCTGSSHRCFRLPLVRCSYLIKIAKNDENLEPLRAS